jgi:putative cell wall-binding protein
MRTSRALVSIVAAAALVALLAAPATVAQPPDPLRFEEFATVPNPGTDVSDAAIHDVDGDYVGDLVCVTDSARLRIFLGDGEGGYTQTEDRALPDDGVSVAVADFDADGNADFAVGLAGGTVGQFYGDGVGGIDGGKPPRFVNIAGASVITDLMTARLDGWTWDLVVADPFGNAGNGRIYVMLNDGFGDLGTPTPPPQPGGIRPIQVGVGDLDDDGDTDIAAVNNLGNEVRLYANDGAGGFGEMAGSPHATGAGPFGIVVNELDGQGRLDIAVANSGSDSVSVYLAGGGTSYLRRDYATGRGPSYLAAGLFTTEPFGTDLAVACWTDDTIQFLVNDAEGTFSAEDTIPVARALRLDSARVDDDLKDDLVLPHTGSVEILRNTAPPVTTRLAGSDRYETAVAISQERWDRGSDAVVIATGETFPDALAGAPLARALRAPILLTRRDALPQVVLDEIARLDPDQAVILGETGAVSQAVVDQLVAAGIPAGEIRRLGGADRYETAYEIAIALDAETPWDTDTVFVATGEDFPDALAGGSFAGMRGSPIVLVRRDEVPQATSDVLADLPAIAESYVLGGEGVVSLSVAARFPDSERLAGPDRYATSRAIADAASEWLADEGAPAPVGLGVATGENFPDALALGPLMSNLLGPVLLTRTASLPPDTLAVIDEQAERAVMVFVAGGTGAVTDEVVHEMEAAY